jgi:Skp family chaperone for outer membrane proteins
MKSLRCFVSTAIVLAVAVVAGAISPAAGQTLPGSVIAIIDMAKIAQGSKAAKHIREQSDAHKKKLIADAKTAEDGLRKEGQELKRQRAILSPEAFAQKRREFDRKAAETQRRLVDRERELKTAFEVARRKVFKEIVSIMSVLQQKFGFNVVLRRKQVEFYAPKTLDITDSVVAELNKRLTKVSVKLPK